MEEDSITFDFEVEEFIKFIAIDDKASILRQDDDYLTPIFRLFAGFTYVDLRGVNFIKEGFSLKYLSVLISAS